MRPSTPASDAVSFRVQCFSLVMSSSGAARQRLVGNSGIGQMKIIFRIITVLLFVLLFTFALKNTQEATLELFMNYEFRGPLVVLLLGFFVGGAVLGVLAMTPTVFRYRREAARQKKTISALEKERDASSTIAPDTLLNIDRTGL